MKISRKKIISIAVMLFCLIGLTYMAVYLKSITDYKKAVSETTFTNINILEHRNERGKSAEAVTNRIVEEQTIDVDAVSGATNSSTVIKKAVENALYF